MVLPLVPVMAAMVSCSEGAPKKRSAMRPTRSLKDGTAATKVPAASSGTGSPSAAARS